jgi:hypothetical protein
MWFELDNRRVGYGYAQTHSDSDTFRSTRPWYSLTFAATFHRAETLSETARWLRAVTLSSLSRLYC